MSNTANDQPPAQTQIVQYAAMATGPFYNTSTPKPHAKQATAMRDAAKLQADELYSIILVKIVVTLTPDAQPTIAVEMTEYDGDEAQRIIYGETPS